jgi:hypothetical protein
MKTDQSDVKGSGKRPGLPLFSTAVVGIVTVVGLGCGESQLGTRKPKADLSQFDHVGAFEDGLAPVRKGVVWAYADESGRTITKFIYEEADGFSEGFAAVKSALPNSLTAGRHQERLEGVLGHICDLGVDFLLFRFELRLGYFCWRDLRLRSG